MTTTTMPFSARIREATAAAHAHAEGSGFFAGLTSGERPLTDYARLAGQHLAIYRAIEGANERMDTDPVASSFVLPELDRVPAIERDLAAILGDGWAAHPEIRPLASTVEYVDRITTVADSWPGGWVAHHYVRYLGDLSGGAFIRRRLEEAYAIDSTTGTAFYDFPAIANARAFKDDYRTRLDQAAWDADEQARITDEILAAYRLNTRFLVELDD